MATGSLLKQFFVSHGSVLGHEIPSGFLSEIDGCNGWNLYPTCKHGNVALTHTVRRELAAIKAPIRITVSLGGFRRYKSFYEPYNFDQSLLVFNVTRFYLQSISPGIVETDIARHTSTISKTLKNIPALRPEDIADAVIYALGTRLEVQVSLLQTLCLSYQAFKSWLLEAIECKFYHRCTIN